MEGHKELQLLPAGTPQAPSCTTGKPPWPPQSPIKFRSKAADQACDMMMIRRPSSSSSSSVDLQLSISLRPLLPPQTPPPPGGDHSRKPESGNCVEAVKLQAEEEIRLAAVEKAYAERLRELTRREMELAQSEFARARHVWERARDEVEKAERMKERAIRRIDSTCMEITCQSCRQKFRP